MKSNQKTISWEEVQRLKAVDRRRDWDRLARKEVTPEELQEENSVLPHDFIVNVKLPWAQIAKSWRRRSSRH